MARKPFAVAAVVLMTVAIAGCEITASVYVQKDWNTDPGMYKANDMITKAEIKATRNLGKEARK